MCFSIIFLTVKVGSCHIEKSALGAQSVGIPEYGGRTQITYSCISDTNCDNAVHVISTYESTTNYRAGTIDVDISISGQDTRALILIFSTYYGAVWNLNIPRGVVIDKAILVRIGATH